MDRPLISVVIPTWNCARYLPATLVSVLSQSWPNSEIIIVDDGSTDNTAAVLKPLENRIKLVTISNSGGPSRPRNVGIGESRGDFIAFFDSDDLMEPDKLSSAMAVFEAHPEVDLVCSSFRGIDTEGKILKDDWLEEYQSVREALVPGLLPETGILEADTAISQLIRANFIGTSSVVVRAQAIKNAGPFIEELKNSDDNEMWFRLARSGCTFAFIDRVLHSYRIVPGGITDRGWRRLPAVIRGLEIQLPHITDPTDLRILQQRLASEYFGLGWGYRTEGQFDEAILAYREGLKLDWTWKQYVALQRARLNKLLPTDLKH